jgi:opacity protein-like surface antigen
MKKISIFFAAAFFIFTTSTVNADPDNFKKFYIGAGGSYGIENFDDGGDFDNSWGINAKIGYHPIDMLAVQFDYDYLREFESDDFFDGKVELDIMTYMLSLKGNFRVKWYNVISPFIIVGAGIMDADADIKDASIAGISADFSNDETDWCAKIGGGFDFFFTENFSANLEGNYTSGLGDLKDIQYFHFILGVIFRFDLPPGNHEF